VGRPAISRRRAEGADFVAEAQDTQICLAQAEGEPGLSIPGLARGEVAPASAAASDGIAEMKKPRPEQRRVANKKGPARKAPAPDFAAARIRSAR